MNALDLAHQGSSVPPPVACPRLDRLPREEIGGDLRLAVARTTRARMLGLSHLDDMPDDYGLLIPRCGSVHTFGMRFALDVVFLDRDHRVIRVAEDVPRRRFVAARRAKSIVETRAGRAEAFVAADLEATLAARAG